MNTKFIEEASERRKKILEQYVLQALKVMLDTNIRFFDTHHVKARTLEIVEKTIAKLNYKSDNIRKARQAFMEVLIDGLQKEIYTLEDDKKEAMKHIRSKNQEEKGKAIDALKKIERYEAKAPKGPTEERDFQCEPICQELARRIMSKDLLLKDEQFISDLIESDNEMLISGPAHAITEDLFDMLYDSIDESYKRANEKHWGCRREEIRFRQLDTRLKD